MTPTRRTFLKSVAAASSLAAGACATTPAPGARPAAAAAAGAEEPWFRRAHRWGQINITEADVQNFDIDFWRRQWKRTRLDAVILNAGGIVCYYPSKYELQHRPPALAGRDLFGELARAARDEGIFLVARMDSSKAYQPLYDAHPDWFAVDAGGRPYRSGEYYLSCINTAYYSQWLPDIMREIIERYHPEGFGDNIWSGVERSMICHCNACKQKFHEYAAADLPTAHDWDDAVYRKWIDWSYQRRTEQWDFNNNVTRAAGGPTCLWIGMNGAGPTGQGASFRDLKLIAERAEFLLLDEQSRSDAGGFPQNAQIGKMVHSLMGWDKPGTLMAESMAMYQHGRPQFRLSAKSAEEARLWMLSGFSGGIMPWWHHVSAYSEDRRSYQTALPVMKWHAENQEYLMNRRPIAPVALAWSNRNADFFGRDDAGNLVSLPWQGFTNALVRARIPYTPLHLDHLDRDAESLSVLILANVGLLTDSQLDAVRRFVKKGGALVATGHTSRYDINGNFRGDLALADLLGAHDVASLTDTRDPRPATQPTRGRFGPGGAATSQHTYLRLLPARAAITDGPHHPDEPHTAPRRHPVLAGFDDTDILPFGSTLPFPLAVSANARVLATFIPAFPESPPEIVYMRTRSTDIPALIVNESNPGRVVYLPAEIDRLYAQFNLADHGDLLANIVRWAARDTLPVSVAGPGLVNVDLYRQRNRLILHLLNLCNPDAWRAPVTELVPAGPFTVTLAPPADMHVTRARSLVTGKSLALGRGGDRLHTTVPAIADHEVLLFE
ncbi:MAG TPA: beta-galactosidase [Phycisphaerae bacterium]|nr:beta-galactosidase [Phycisphaerae bacterium]